MSYQWSLTRLQSALEDAGILFLDKGGYFRHRPTRILPRSVDIISNDSCVPNPGLPMPAQTKKYHPALKHAGYASTGILPGENPAEFEKLHRDLIAELGPNGALEKDIVATMARLVWRKTNLITFRIAQLARTRFAEINSKIPQDRTDYEFLTLGTVIKVDPAVREAAIRAADEQARKELGDTYGLVEIGDIATVDHLMKDLEVQDRLDAMIDKCLKRLLFLRGIKSISSASTSTPRERLTGPSKAA